jgi:hypothetical protein
MFGLMKGGSCRATAGERESRRLHYCGTCKTMGRIYSQKSRLFVLRRGWGGVLLLCPRVLLPTWDSVLN